jgi:hypothetical protein
MSAAIVEGRSFAGVTLKTTGRKIRPIERFPRF